MIVYDTFTLENGLQVICHQDQHTHMAATSLLYKVGSRNEAKRLTGVAHLFEHLMFGGSEHAPEFDTPIQNAGGDNNAFTNADITNYYETLPAQNLDIALWLEADRMAHLSLSDQAIEVQKKVVIEEFYETCLNRPYGDSWHNICGLAYPGVSYQWPTIGLKPEHIKAFTREDALKFYETYYQPGNAILTVASPYTSDEVRAKAEKWFGQIKGNPVTPIDSSDWQANPKQYQKQIDQQVPAPHLYLAFPMVGRTHEKYYHYDLLSDILGHGISSRLYARLVKEKQYFTFINSYISGVEGPGLFIVDGRLAHGVNLEEAKAAIWQELKLLTVELVKDKELQKVQNKAISTMRFTDVSLLSRAINLSYYASLGDIDLMNHEDKKYEAVTPEGIMEVSNLLFEEQPHFEVYYHPI